MHFCAFKVAKLAVTSSTSVPFSEVQFSSWGSCLFSCSAIACTTPLILDPSLVVDIWRDLPYTGKAPDYNKILWLRFNIYMAYFICNSIIVYFRREVCHLPSLELSCNFSFNWTENSIVFSFLQNYLVPKKNRDKVFLRVNYVLVTALTGNKGPAAASAHHGYRFLPRDRPAALQ